MSSKTYNNIIIYTLLVFFCILKTECFGQSFIEKGTKNYYKYEVAQEVLKKISYAKGDNKPLPILRISTKKGFIAEFKPNVSNSSIILDEFLYDICSDFGSDSLNALACVIGHELGHYFLGHNGGFGFSNKKAFSLGPNELVEIERKADEFGVYYGFLAGYDTREILPFVLDNIYNAYKLNQELSGYPLLDERKQIANNSIKNTNELGHVFTFGKLLYGINKTEEAANCFEYIAPKFPSKEIYNNIGVIYLREYISKDFESDSINKFIYPIEFDPQTRLLPKETLRSSEFNSWIPDLEVIVEYFERALKLDDEYIEASINLATTYVLMEDYDSSAGIINQLKKRLDTKETTMPESAFTIRGISKALSGNFIMAEENFNNVISDNDINKYNKKVLNALQNNEPYNFYNWVVSFFQNEEISVSQSCQVESIGNINISGVTLDNKFIYKDLDGYEDIAYKENKDCTLYCILKNNQIQFTIIQTDKGYTGKTGKGLSLGSNKSEIIHKYGTPLQIITFNKEKMYTYFNQHISFIVENNTVKSWQVWK